MLCCRTWEKVIEEVTFVFLAAKIREETSSLALEQIGVMMKDK